MESVWLRQKPWYGAKSAGSVQMIFRHIRRDLRALDGLGGFGLQGSGIACGLLCSSFCWVSLFALPGS